ncbi:MAG: protease modulator HflC [Spirochaetales bacterium]|nr:protease modulator HflC [Spirochaetales bacterium]
MNKLVRTAVIIAVIFVLVMILRPFFIVQEGQQAVVIRFGKLIRTETEAGFKIKMPGIDNVQYYPKKTLSWDGDAKKIPNSDQQYIWVDTTARWRITNPTLFYEAVKTENQAHAKLDDIIESAVKTVIAQYPLEESVRNTNQIIESQQLKAKAEAEAEAEAEAQRQAEGADSSPTLAQAAAGEDEVKEITQGRLKLSEDMLSLAKGNTPKYGIELIDIVIRQIKYSDELTPSVYERMIQERAQKAQFNRSAGEGQKEEWLGLLSKKKDTILSEAYDKSEAIKGEADAKAAAIYAEAYGQDEDFYNFWKAMESYKNTMPGLKKTLTTDMDYFDYLYDKE